MLRVDAVVFKYGGNSLVNVLENTRPCVDEALTKVTVTAGNW